MIWYNKKIIVVHAPRCAGTSFEELLRYNASCHSLMRKLLWKVDSRVHLDGPMRTGFKHIRASDYRSILGDSYYDSAIKVAFLRNPYDRVISHFHYKAYRDSNALSGVSLPDFIKQFKPKDFERGDLLSDYYDDEIDYYIRYENYDEGVQFVCRQLDLKYVNLQDGKTQRKSNWRGYFDQEARDLVYQRYQQDFENYEYSYDLDG
jgi:chondroitin 4-sulfotransferase 11